MWCLTKKRPQQHFRWLRSSTDDVRNIIADRLADCGTQPALQLPWWRRTPKGGWEEEAFVAKIVSFQRETTPCAGAFPVYVARPSGCPNRLHRLQKSSNQMGCRETRKHVPSCTRSYNGGAAESGPEEPVHSLSSYAQETGGPSVQDSNEIGSTIAFEQWEVPLPFTCR